MASCSILRNADDNVWLTRAKSSRVVNPPGGGRISLRRSIARFRIRRAGIKDAGEACKTNGERASPMWRPLPNCMWLEAENGAAFGAKISPFMLVQTLEQR